MHPVNILWNLSRVCFCSRSTVRICMYHTSYKSFHTWIGFGYHFWLWNLNLCAATLMSTTSSIPDMYADQGRRNRSVTNTILLAQSKRSNLADPWIKKSPGYLECQMCKPRWLRRSEASSLLFFYGPEHYLNDQRVKNGRICRCRYGNGFSKNSGLVIFMGYVQIQIFIRKILVLDTLYKQSKTYKWNRINNFDWGIINPQTNFVRGNFSLCIL